MVTRDDGVYHEEEAQPCSCRAAEVEEHRRASLLAYCHLPRGTESMTFETFRAYTPDLVEARDAAKLLVDPDGPLEWLTLMSKVDRGKSHLAVAVCREWLERGVPARYVFVPDMLDELREGFQTDAEWTYKQAMHFYKTVPFLVLDDLGRGKATPWGIEKLGQIINSRLEEGLRLFVTTNKPLNDIPGDDDQIIGSRLRRHQRGRVIAIEDAGEYSLRKEAGR